MKGREVEYEIGPEIPAEIRLALHERLGARVGDVVLLLEDGTVALGRQASAEDARALMPHLLRLPASFCPSASSPRPAVPRAGGHLKLEK